MALALSLKDSAVHMIESMVSQRKILNAVTRVELNKRYSGSLFGPLWVLFYPALLLANYIFVYMVVFKVRFPGYSEFDYVLYVFCGLIPYLGLSEAITSGYPTIKQNLHLVKNVMLPIELIPIRGVLVSMVSQVVSLVILLPMLLYGGHLSWHWLWLPAVFLLQIMFLIGIVLILASIYLVLPDLGYFVNVLILMLMFISPIGFKMDMVPPTLQFMVYFNPVYYLVEMYRSSLLYGSCPSLLVGGGYMLMCVGTFAAGSAFFRKFRDVLVDFE